MAPVLRTDLVHFSFPQEVYQLLSEEDREDMEDAAVGPLLVSRGRITVSIPPERLDHVTPALDSFCLQMERHLRNRVHCQHVHGEMAIQWPHRPFDGKAV